MWLIRNDFIPRLSELFSRASHAVHICSFMVSAPSKFHRTSYRTLWGTLETFALRGGIVQILFDLSRRYSSVDAKLEEQIKKYSCLPFSFRFFSGSRKLHSKYIIIDNQFCYIGSHNLTPKGLHSNIETGILFRSPEICLELFNDFSTLWRQSHAIN